MKGLLTGLCLLVAVGCDDTIEQADHDIERTFMQNENCLKAELILSRDPSPEAENYIRGYIERHCAGAIPWEAVQ